MLPSISIIVPVFREAGIINPAVARLNRLSGAGESEIIVVDGGPGGETVAAIGRTGVVTILSPKGRGIQMNAGARAASGEILLFLHADTRLPSEGLDRIRVAMADRRWVGGAFDLGIDSNRRIFRILERAASLRSRLTRIPYGDQAIFIRSAFFREIGGYRNIPIMEDVELMRRIKSTGHGIVFLPDRVRTSARRWEREGVAGGTLRNWLLVLLFLAGMSPERLARFYR